MTELTVEPETPQGKGKLVFWGVGALLLVAAGVVVYVLMSKKPPPASPPTDSQGKLADWKRRDGYVGSVDPVECTKDSAGQQCQKNGAAGTCQLLKTPRSPGIASGASPGPTASYDCVAAVPGGPGWAANGQDCAAACYASGNYWALFNSGKNTCVCRPKADELSFWDRCVPKNVDDRGWEVWSSPEHQQDCDSSVNAIPGVWKGVAAIPPVATFKTGTVQGCQTEIKGRLGTDVDSYGVFDKSTGFCYVKTDDPTANPFWECKNGDTRDTTSQYSLITPKTPDDIENLPPCHSVAAIKVQGRLPQSYLRAKPVPNVPVYEGNTQAGATACLDACGIFDAGKPGYSVPGLGARPAMTWDGENCICYDFPEHEVPWKCQYQDQRSLKDDPQGLMLYVRNDPDHDPLAVKVPENYTLPPCPHDPDGAGPLEGDHDCANPLTTPVCSESRGDTDGKDQCAYTDPPPPQFIPMWGNGLQCNGGVYDGACITGTMVRCDDNARCGPNRPMFSGPCQVGTGDKNCPPNMICYPVIGNLGLTGFNGDSECGACQYKNDSGGRLGAGGDCSTSSDPSDGGAHGKCISGICDTSSNQNRCR
jgi:hypothetical protein